MLAPTSRRMESRSGDVSQIAVEQAPEGARLSVARADELVMQLVADHADSLLRVAPAGRRLSRDPAGGAGRRWRRISPSGQPPVRRQAGQPRGSSWRRPPSL